MLAKNKSNDNSFTAASAYAPRGTAMTSTRNP